MEPEAPAGPIYVSTRVAAQRLGVGIHTVHAMIRAGELHAIDISRRDSLRPHLRIHTKDLDAFAQRKHLKATQPREWLPLTEARQTMFGEDVPPYSTILNWIRKGVGKRRLVCRAIGTKLYLRQADVDTFLAACQERVTAGV